MEPSLFTIIVGIAGFLGAGAITMLFQRQAATQQDIAQLRESLPKEYVAKADFKSELVDIKVDIKEILRELRNKADRDE